MEHLRIRDMKEIIERLDRIIELLEGLSLEKRKTKVRKEDKTSRGDMETIEGRIKNVEFKKGAKCGEFAIFTLEGTQKGVVPCKCFDSKLFDKIEDNLKVVASGKYQNYNGYNSFIVRDIMEEELEDNRSTQPTANDSNDDMPF